MEREKLAASMNSITIVSSQKSNRLNYVCQWLFKDILGLGFTIVTPSENIDVSGFIVFYGIENAAGFSIPDTGLLWENGFSKKELANGQWENIPTLFQRENHGSIPFDLFSAIFYLLARYEEYIPFLPDKHNRFPHQQSVLFQNDCLQRPLIDEWVFQLKLSLESHFNCSLTLPRFTFKPTYDIDIAYSYQHKGIVRWAGAFTKDFLKGNFHELRSRIDVLLKKTVDPFDCFDWLQKTHNELNLDPVFFILAAQKNTAFDKNNLPSKSAMKTLISSLAQQGKIGLHPSYFSNEKTIFQREKKLLESISDKPITSSRQHYIRLQIPKTYKFLIENGIKEDYSMGYGAALGFRAGTGRSFFWFDLEKNEETGLRVHPFCFMDSTAHFEEKMSVKDAEKTLVEMFEILKKTNSLMITVFHNFTLGTAGEWTGWQDFYFSFLKKAK